MKVKSILYNIITSNIRINNLGVTYRVMLLNSFLLFGAFSMFFTLIYRLFHPVNYTYIFIDIITSFSFMGSFIWLRVSQNIKGVSIFSSLIIVIFMLGFIYENKSLSLGVVWTYTVPIYTILLNGYKTGGILTAIFYALLTIIYIFDVQNWVQYGHWDTLSLIRYIMTSAILVSICLAYDYIFSKFQENLYEQSYTDTLTGLNNRRSIDETLFKELEKQKRHYTNLSFSILDIDDFKMINDEFGHLVGDRVLKDFSLLLSENIRVNDIVGRWGGEEFCVISTNTSLAEAISLLDRLREKISMYDFGLKKNLTCSFGVSYLKKDFNLESLIQQADKMLYKAKQNGKNMVCYQ